MNHKKFLCRWAPKAALLAGVASVPPLALLWSGAEAATRAVYVTIGMKEVSGSGGRSYAEPWSLSDYEGYNSDCDDDGVAGDPEFPGYGGWWHCDSGEDQQFHRYHGLDLHRVNSEGAIVTAGHPVSFNAYHPQGVPSPAPYAVIRHRDSCDDGVTVELHYGSPPTVANMFLEIQYLHLSNRAAEAQFDLNSGWKEQALGQVDASTTNCFPPHLHQAARESSRNQYSTIACWAADADPSSLERCYYDNAWSGDPPTNLMFYGTYSFSSGSAGGGGGSSGGGGCWALSGKC